MALNQNWSYQPTLAGRAILHNVGHVILTQCAYRGKSPCFIIQQFEGENLRHDHVLITINII